MAFADDGSSVVAPHVDKSAQDPWRSRSFALAPAGAICNNSNWQRREPESPASGEVSADGGEQSPPSPFLRWRLELGGRAARAPTPNPTPQARCLRSDTKPRKNKRPRTRRGLLGYRLRLMPYATLRFRPRAARPRARRATEVGSGTGVTVQPAASASATVMLRSTPSSPTNAYPTSAA